jgi:maleate cis-trans isomerase
MMYGWRGRVGHISPAILDTSAEECRKLLPAGVLHVGLSISLPVQRMAPEELDRAGQLMVDAARRLAAEECDVIVAGGAPATARQGPAADDALLSALREASGLPCTTANRAVVEALDALGMRRVAVVSPFVDARNDEIRSYMAACGVEVVAARGLGLRSNLAIARQPASAAYNLARAIVGEAPDVDGIYIACPRWPVVDIVEAVEADTRKPVVAGVTAMMWHALRLVGLGEPPPGRGRLMETLL